jgi:hypothetical protein
LCARSTESESPDYLEVLEGIQGATDEFLHSNKAIGPVQKVDGEKGGEILSGS